jgi:hypothetical protein
MDNELTKANRIIRSIVERLPSNETLYMFDQLRRSGVEWEEIESQGDEVAEGIAGSALPFSGEAEQYVRRLFIAGRAHEVGGANN